LVSFQPRLAAGAWRIASADVVNHRAITQPPLTTERMIEGDVRAGKRSTTGRDAKTSDRRGAGRDGCSIYGRGAGEGFGVHIMTGPISIPDALPGDVLECGILWFYLWKLSCRGSCRSVLTCWRDRAPIQMTGPAAVLLRQQRRDLVGFHSTTC